MKSNLHQITISATKRKPKDDEDTEEYSGPPAKIKRDAFGYVASGKTGKTEGCKSCYYFEKLESECELFEALQGKLPGLFELDKSVSSNAGCEAHILRKEKV